MLIMVFVFGSVDYAHAAENVGISDVVSHFSIAGDYLGWSGTFSGGYIVTVFSVQNNSGKIVAFNDYNSHGFYSNEPFSVTVYEYYRGKYEKYNSISASLLPNNLYFYSSSGTTIEYDNEVCTMLCFRKQADALNYLSTGEINNPIYQPSIYDENIPTPKNLEVYFDRKLNKPFNLSELCNPLKIKWSIPEDEDFSSFTLDVQIDVNYNKLNSISGIGTKPTVLSTGKVEFASCSAADKELNISSTYDGWTKLSEKYQASIWGLTGNYFDLWLRYKDSSGNYGNWVKVTINPDNSSTVVKSGFFENGTSTTINKGYEEISGDNESHVPGDYDNYYVNTYDDTSLSSNLTSLKSNYSNLVSFYREFFGFLPSEIWIILIGLVSTMALIAILKFVRG